MFFWRVSLFLGGGRSVCFSGAGVGPGLVPPVCFLCFLFFKQTFKTLVSKLLLTSLLLSKSFPWIPVFGGACGIGVSRPGILLLRDRGKKFTIHCNPQRIGVISFSEENSFPVFVLPLNVILKQKTFHVRVSSMEPSPNAWDWNIH